MPKWKLVVEYEGTRYRGWQEQQNARTVQGELRKAAENFFQDRVDIGGAGRTDAGVHALAQAAHLKALKLIQAHKLRQELNDRLPADINIRNVVEVPNRFHARHDALERFYVYQIATSRTAFGKPFVWWVKDKLDLAAMQQAARLFIGRHDFSSFCEQPKQQPSTIVEVTHCELGQRGDLILFRIGASHFLWKMVRRLVGVIVEVGRGNFTGEDAQKFLTTYNNSLAQFTAPPSGLFLECVRYEGDESIGALAPAIWLR